MTHNVIEIAVGEVTDMEVRVYARYDSQEVGETQLPQIVLRGTLRGPYCELAHTLPAEFAFHSLDSGPTVSAEAMITDPCMWSPELPHLYRADVEALRDAQVVAEYHGMIGLQRTNSPRSDLPNP